MKILIKRVITDQGHVSKNECNSVRKKLGGGWILAKIQMLMRKFVQGKYVLLIQMVISLV